jgi:hypothetical protein
MRSRGFQRAFNLAGGIRAWIGCLERSSDERA